MSDVSATVDTYLAMWNETDRQRRAALIEQVWVPEGRYVDPLLEAEGHGSIDAMVAGVHEQFPGHRFRRVSGIDTHHDQVRFAWELVAPDGSVTVSGIDVAEVSGDGRLRRVVGFFGELPDGA